MFIKVKDFIINTEHITYAEWRKINEGSPSETHNLIIYFAVSAKNSSLSLREDKEVKRIWAFLEKQCQSFGTNEGELAETPAERQLEAFRTTIPLNQS